MLRAPKTLAAVMSNSPMSKDEVVDRLFAVFTDQGYDGATLAEISRATGLGKSSLYHHFPGGKEDMALAVLARADEWLRVNVIAAVNGPGTPRDRLMRMLDAFNTIYAGGKNACVLGKLVAGTARPLFQRQLREIFSRWIGALEKVAVDAGVPQRIARSRAEDAVAGIQGALILSAGLADSEPFRRRLRAIVDDLLAKAPKR